MSNSCDRVWPREVYRMPPRAPDAARYGCAVRNRGSGRGNTGPWPRGTESAARPFSRGSGMEEIMRKTVLALAVAAVTLSLGACGYSRGDRALSGGAIGAAGGAAVGGLTGGSALGGALLGGAAGAATGALTSPSDINLGRPAWR